MSRVSFLKSSCVAGLRTPERLSESAAAWVDSKRRDLTQLMWDAAGIVRRRADMKAALQQLATLHHEVQVSAYRMPSCRTSYTAQSSF